MGSQDLEDPWFNGGPIGGSVWTSPLSGWWGVYGIHSFHGSPPWKEAAWPRCHLNHMENLDLWAMPQVLQPPGQTTRLVRSMLFGGRQGGNIFFFGDYAKQHIFWGMRKIEDRIYDIYIHIYICTLYLKQLLLWITFCCFYQYLWSLLNISITSTGNG